MKGRRFTARWRWLSLALLLPLSLLSMQARAQTPAEALDLAWQAICADAPPESDFYQRCQEILNAGPGSGDRRSAAALGNNLGVFAAQIKLGRYGRGSRARGDRHRKGRDPALSLDGDDDGDLLWESERWGVFATAFDSNLRRNTSLQENGFHADASGLLLGVDYRFSPNVVGLINFGVRRNDARFANDSGHMDEDARGFGLGLYGQIGEHFGWQISGARESLDYDIARRIFYRLVLNAGTPDQIERVIDFTATGTPGGSQTQYGIAADWSWQHGSNAFRLLGSADYSRVQVDPFRESGGGGLSLIFGERVSRSIRGQLGVEWSSTQSAGFGIWAPWIRLDWIHEFRDDGRLLGARFAADPGAFLIRFRSDDPDRSFGNLGVGVNFTFVRGWSAFVSADRSLKNDILTETRISIGLRKSL